jgi:LPS export ABC transporter protein LptC
VVLKTKSAITVLLLGLIGMLSCGQGNDAITTVTLESGILPAIHGENISSLISDSGITRYRLETKMWDIYSGEPEPYWFFPQGVYLERFDSLFHVQGYVTADTAYYYEKKGLWHLKGNVHVQNLQGETFDTSELFYNQKAPPNSVNAVYADTSRVVRIHTGNTVIDSYGFRSDHAMNQYRFYKSRIVTVIDENEEE